MGKNDDALEEFIAKGIPNDKLTSLPKTTANNPIAKDGNFRLDMQGMTTSTTENPEQKHNLQVQVNKNPVLRSLKKFVPNTVTRALVVGTESADDIKNTFREKVNFPAGEGDRQKNKNKEKNKEKNKDKDKDKTKNKNKNKNKA